MDSSHALENRSSGLTDRNTDSARHKKKSDEVDSKDGSPKKSLEPDSDNKLKEVEYPAESKDDRDDCQAMNKDVIQEVTETSEDQSQRTGYVAGKTL